MARSGIRGVRLLGIALAMVLGMSAAVVVGGGAAQAAGCPAGNVAALGIPGSKQGAERNPGATDPKVLYGEQVHAALEALRASGVVFDATHLSYPADGADWAEPVTAKYFYTGSAYEGSKNSGYDRAIAWVRQKVAECPDVQVIMVGYSQGAHIAGDLTQTIQKGEGGLGGPSRLKGTILLADPAYNSTDPQSLEFGLISTREPSSTPGSESLIPELNLADPAMRVNHYVKLVNDARPTQGVLGRRDHFSSESPVMSVCIFEDPVCDHQGDSHALAEKDRHGMYLVAAESSRYSSATLAGWAATNLTEKY